MRAELRLRRIRSPQYDGMPNSAVASGAIDMVLAPKGIAQALIRMRDHPYVAGSPAANDGGSESDRNIQLAQIFRLLKQVCKVDFSDYKPATIRRRIMRRMALRRADQLSDYVNLLQEDRNEVEALYQDILINVTSFFRDPDVFDAINKTVYPALFRDRAPTDTIRVWVPGCSTGEEAYSHAIVLLEYVTSKKLDVPVQIFATDLSPIAIRKARTGVYKKSIISDVSPSRLSRFFNKVDGGYQVSKMVRDVCVFANQNVFSDPPFTHIDVVSCRNVLIYLSQVLQKRVIPVFHYSLRPGGYLVIGNAEGLVGTGAELFEPVHKKHKIYRKKAVPSPVTFGIPQESLGGNAEPEPAAASFRPDLPRTATELQREADRLLLTKYVPAAVVLSADMDILQTRGHASRYLELPSGKPTLNLMKMIKPGMLFEVKRIIDEAKSAGAPVRRNNLQVESDGELLTISVEAIPFPAPPYSDGSILLVFEDGGAPAKPVQPGTMPQKVMAKDSLIAQLRQELAATKEYQQSIIEALEASNEELQSANEEIQSGNEELQSTNEELQTSKEELESANEELNTVNEEMQHRNYQLGQVNNDLVNLLTSVNMAIVMLSSDLSIRRFTPKAEELLGLTSADVGRPLVHVRLRMNIPEFEHTMIQVMRDGEVRLREFEDGKHWYRLRLTPYRTTDNAVEGVVAVFFDISDFRVAMGKVVKHPKRS